MIDIVISQSFQLTQKKLLYSSNLRGIHFDDFHWLFWGQLGSFLIFFWGRVCFILLTDDFMSIFFQWDFEAIWFRFHKLDEFFAVFLWLFCRFGELENSIVFLTSTAWDNDVLLPTSILSGFFIFRVGLRIIFCFLILMFGIKKKVVNYGLCKGFLLLVAFVV